MASTNLLLRMKPRRSECPNLGLPPKRYGWSPREKPRSPEDQARVTRIRQEALLAEERVKRLEDDLKRSIDESKDRILRMKLRPEEDAWRRYEQTKLQRQPKTAAKEEHQRTTAEAARPLSSTRRQRQNAFTNHQVLAYEAVQTGWTTCRCRQRQKGHASVIPVVTRRICLREKCELPRQ